MSGLRIYTIYSRPSDLPGVEFAVRGCTVTSADTVFDDELTGTAASLDDARELIPSECDACIPRSPTDLPGIVECWL